MLLFRLNSSIREFSFADQLISLPYILTLAFSLLLSCNVHGDEMRDEKAFVGNRRVRQIHVVASCEELLPYAERLSVLR